MMENKLVTRTPPSGRPTARRQRGASMIELLVSVLIFAFGMLGVVGMMTKTLGYSQISLYRSQATALADDILDRMRTDPANARNGNWSTELDDAASSFTGTTIAQTELKDWKTGVEGLLPACPSGPSAGASISITGNLVTVTIQWCERLSDTAGAAPTTTSFTTVSSL
jgi:type IV pilus assembly protein PilV